MEEFLDAGRKQAQLLEEARDARSLGQAAEIFQQRLPPVVQRRQQIANEIGFEECGA